MFGIGFADGALRVPAVLIAAGFFGLMFSFALEMDAGFASEDGGLFWVPMIFTVTLFGLTFATFAGAGGPLFVFMAIMTRVVISALGNRFAPYDVEATFDQFGDVILLANLFVIPVAALII